MNKKKRGRRPLPPGFSLIKFFASEEDAAYLNRVKQAQDLSTRTDAIRLIVADARTHARFLPGIDANIADPQA